MTLMLKCDKCGHYLLESNCPYCRVEELKAESQENEDALMLAVAEIRELRAKLARVELKNKVYKGVETYDEWLRYIKLEQDDTEQSDQQRCADCGCLLRGWFPKSPNFLPVCQKCSEKMEQD